MAMITDDQLQDYIDGNISVEQAKLIESAISSDPTLNERYKQMQLVDQVLQQQPLQSPSAAFNDRVMSGLSRELTTRTKFWRLSLFVAIGVILVGFLAAAVLLSNYSLGEVFSTDITKITFQNETINLGPQPIGYQDIFFKGLIYLNGFLGLFLLERAVLRPFFRWRRQQLSF